MKSKNIQLEGFWSSQYIILERKESWKQISGEFLLYRNDRIHVILLAFSIISKFVIAIHFQIPIVESEIKKEAGELKPEEEVAVGPVQKLVTEMGTYATQSALSSSRPAKKEEDR